MRESLLLATIVLSAACGGATPHAPAGGGRPAPLELVARVDDAAAVPVGTRVVVAGLGVGRVTRHAAVAGGTLIALELRGDLEVWASATLTRKAGAVLGEHYLELDPGADGAPLGPRCPGYASAAPAEARRCREITNVVERVTPDQLLQRIDAALPREP